MSLADDMGAMEGVMMLILADLAVWFYDVAEMQLVLRARLAAATLRVVAAANLSLPAINRTLPDALHRVCVIPAACPLALAALSIASGPVCRSAAGPSGWSCLDLLSRFHYSDAVLHVPKVLMFGP